jgi:biotin carboxylase
MKSCIIVDAYRFSKDYLHYLNKKNMMCIHVQSSQSLIPDLAKLSTYDPNAYIDNFIYDGNLNILLAQLQKYNPETVIAGMEPGVILADELSNMLGVKSNNLIQSKARRDKCDMIRALEIAGVPCMKYIKTSHPQEAITWIHKNTNYPVVIKPLESAGTEGVYICQTEEALIENFDKILGKKNCLGLSNDSVLVQEFLQGTEYMINSVSSHGKHYFTDIWRCNKRHIEGHGMIYDREELLESEGEIQNQITFYLRNVLDALGIKFGGAHSEIMYTKQGPILIEVGARVGGNVNCISHTECLGKNQLELIVDAYVDEESFLKKTSCSYSLLKNAMTILLSTQQEGIVESIPIIETIEACTSLYWYHLNVSSGDYLKPTRDLFSSPGKVILIHEDKNIIEQEYKKLMEAIPKGFLVKKFDGAK